MQYPPVSALVPHRPPMRLVDAIVGEVDGALVCRTEIKDDFVFLRDGQAELAVCVELVAQSVACFAGLRDVREGRRPKAGFLVGCRSARFDGEPLRPGDTLDITVKSSWVREPAASFAGRVVRRDAVVADVEVVVVSTDGDVAAAMGAFGG